MQIDRQKQWQFLEDELHAETENFSVKFNSHALHLLQETGEMFVAQFIKFKKGEMITMFPNTRGLPRKGDYLFSMILPEELRNYHNWKDKTYHDLFNERFKGSEAVCIWHSPTEDKRFTLVGFRGFDIEFAEMVQDVPGLILVFAPQRPPLEYVANLQKIVEDKASQQVSFLLDYNWLRKKYSPILIKNRKVSEFMLTQLTLTDTCILQGPPGTGKTTTIAEICHQLCKDGKSVMVTALTNRALMEIALKGALKDEVQAGKVLKTNLTVDEMQECKGLVSLKKISPMPSSLVLSTYFIASSFAKEITSVCPFDYVIMDEASQALLAMFAAAKKIGKVNLWVGDIKQMPPVVSLNSDRIKRSNYMGLVNGLDFITNNTEVPVYQMTETYRLTERAVSYTGIFYQNSLVAKKHATVQPINMLGGLMKPEGGPALILTDLRQGDYSPMLAVTLAANIVCETLKEYPKMDIAVLSCMIRTVKALQKAILSKTGTHNNLIIDTVARIQGLTTDITVFVVPNVSYFYTLEKHLFNVATSRSLERTIIIADKNVFNYAPMDYEVREYLERLSKECSVYLPFKSSKNLYIEKSE